MTPHMADRPTLALIDYETIATNPVGSVHRRVIAGLCEHYDITVFSVSFDNPRPDRIRWVRVPAVRRPLLALFLTFHVAVLARFAWERIARRRRFDVVQSIESFSFLGTVIHAQFCHRFFVDAAMDGAWAPGYRGWARQVFERAAAALEPRLFGRASLVVVPSIGAGRAIVMHHPEVEPKLRPAYNGIDAGRMRPPQPIDVAAQRSVLGLPADGLLLVFVALGHFERKGLPLVLDALERIDLPVRLAVVGGTAQATAPYRRRVETGPLRDRVCFTGTVQDVRPYLWCADAFVLPSAYEGFPLVALEAAAAGLPLIATAVNGIEEVLVDGDAGLLVERDAVSIAAAIDRFARLDADTRTRMAARARAVVAPFSDEAMIDSWRAVYEEARGATGPGPGMALRATPAAPTEPAEIVRR